MAKAEYPENFPGRKQLEDAGVGVEQARGMSEDDLKKIDGIGPKTAADIVAFFGAGEGETSGAQDAKVARAESGPQASVKSVRDGTGHTNVIR